MSQVFLTGKETQEGPALFRHMIPNGTAQHRIARLQGIQNAPLRKGPLNFNFHFEPRTRQSPQMGRKHDPNHGKV